MPSYDVPTWTVQALCEQGELTDASYHLYGAGRALTFVRMAADTLETLANEQANDQKAAEYHAYAGISGARTAIDAAASWLRVELSLGRPLTGIDFHKKPYRNKVVQKKPDLEAHVQALGNLAASIDKHRQRAQHREGLALRFHSPGSTVAHPGGWYLAPKGIGEPGTNDLRLADLLQRWADQIEQNVCAMVPVMQSSLE
jgi:hypothetical protein